MFVKILLPVVLAYLNFFITNAAGSLKIFKNCLLHWSFSNQSDFDNQVLISGRIFNNLFSLYFSKACHIVKIQRTELDFNSAVKALPLISNQSATGSDYRYTRHHTCFVHLYILATDYGIPGLENQIRDPDFIIYILSHLLSLSVFGEISKQILRKINSEAKPLALKVTEHTVINMITQIRLYSFPPSVTTTIGLNSNWNGLHKTFSSTSISVNTASPSLSCSWPAKASTNRCTLNTISSKLNLTLKFTRSNRIFENDLTTDLVLNHRQTKLLRFLPNSRLNFPVPGIHAKTLAYIIVHQKSDHSRGDLKQMAKPFQGEVWLCILLSMLIVPLVQYVFAKLKHKTQAVRHNLSYLSWIFLFHANISSQCNDAVTKLLRLPHSKFLWTLWSFYGILITNAYDGQLYSFLAKSDSPTSPNSLYELASSAYSIVTVDTFLKGFTRNGSAILESSLESIFSKQTLNQTTPEYYRQLGHRTNFVSNYNKNMAQLIRELNFFGRNQSQGFAIVDTEQQVESLYPAMDWTNKWKVVNYKRISIYSSSQAWAVRKSFIYKRLEFLLWQLLECGVSHLWLSYTIRNRQIMGLQSIGNDFNQLEKGASPPRKSGIISYVNQGLQKNVQDQECINQSKALSQKKLGFVFRGTLFILWGLLLVCFLEIAYDWVLTWFVSARDRRRTKRSQLNYNDDLVGGLRKITSNFSVSRLWGKLF